MGQTLAPDALSPPAAEKTTLDLDKIEGQQGLSGRATWGDGGAIRLLLRERRLSRDFVVLSVVNEGTKSFTVHPSDTWIATTDEKKQVRLRRSRWDQRRRIIAPPNGSARIWLSPTEQAKGRIASLVHTSKQLGRGIEVRTPYSAPVPRLVILPTLPAGFVPGTPRIARFTLAVDAQGRVGKVTVELDESRNGMAFREVASRAFEQWIFSPALEKGTPTPGIYEDDLIFGDRVVVRAVFPTPPAELGPRLSRLLQGSFTAVRSLPSAGGFIIRGKPTSFEGSWSIKTFLVRFGAQPKTEATWVTVTSVALITRNAGARCECSWWESQTESPRQLMEWLTRNLGAIPTEMTTLAPVGDSWIPSGLLEPSHAGAWRREAIGNFLVGALPPEATGRATEAGDDGPDENAFLKSPTPEGPTDEREVVPPELVKRVQPRYPETARRARIQGRVVLQAVIDASGRVRDLQVLRSIPLLDGNAIEAVCCWRYKPARVNGTPVPVYEIVVVDYTLK